MSVHWFSDVSFASNIDLCKVQYLYSVDIHSSLVSSIRLELLVTLTLDDLAMKCGISQPCLVCLQGIWQRRD